MEKAMRLRQIFRLVGGLVARLNQKIAAILDSADARTAFEAHSLVVATSTPAAPGEIVVRDRARWADVVAKRGIQSSE